MNQKGQIISVDFLLSVILVVLALGFMIQFAEARQYSEKQALEFRDTERIALTASDLLVSGPDTTCKVSGTDINLNNCIPETVQVTKAKLGIPSEYGCSLSGMNFSGGNECDALLPNDKDYYSIQRNVVSYSGDVPKGILDDCMKGLSCGLQEKTLELKVWE